jgi:PTS system mannose-specific IIA component
MIGLVIVAHGGLAPEFLAALEHVLGPQPQAAAVVVRSDQDAERVDSGEGVAVLTDMFGGMASNLAISAVASPDIETVAGVNLPMLIKFAQVRPKLALREAVAAAHEAGCKHIRVCSTMLTPPAKGREGGIPR